MAKKNKPTQLQTNYYDENGQVVNFEKGTIERYFELEKQLKDSMLNVAKTLHQIQQEKLYLIRGYTDFKTYATDIFGYSYRMVHNYIKVHETFGDTEYAGIPITQLVRLASNSQALEVYSKAKNKAEALQNLLFEITKPKEKEVIEKTEKPILTAYEIIRSFREEVNLFTNKVNTTNYLDDNKAVIELVEIKKDLDQFWNDLEPIVLARLEEITIEKQKTEAEKEIVVEKEVETETEGDIDPYDITTFFTLSGELKTRLINIAISNLIEAIQEENEAEKTRYISFLLQALPVNETDATEESIRKSKILLDALDGDIESVIQILTEMSPIEIDWV